MDGELPEAGVVDHHPRPPHLAIAAPNPGPLARLHLLEILAHAQHPTHRRSGPGGRARGARPFPSAPLESAFVEAETETHPRRGPSAADPEAPSRESVEEAAAALRAHLRPTPIQPSPAFTAKVGCPVAFKIETIQPTRAFKVRGALNRLIRLHPEERAAGVVTASAGNHGQGVAYAAHVFGAPATIFVPTNANPLKVEAIQRLGGRVVYAGRSYREAEAEALRAQAAGGATFVHAFDDPHVIAGQGTIAVEMLEQMPDLDTVVVPVGGGGLIAGISLYLKARRPSIRVVGVEPAGADAMSRSLEEGRPVTLDGVVTIADGLAASAPGRLALQIAERCVDQMIRVEERAMLRAIRLLFEWEHLLAEPAGVAALAAILYQYAPTPRERVVVLLSGANVSDKVLLSALRER
jgi:threonine dehydratase